MFQKMSSRKASITIALTTFVSYGVGLFRDKILAFYFGTSTLSDIYNSAFIVPDIILNGVILGALSGVFIPIFMSAMAKGEDEANQLGSVFIILMSGAVVLFSLLGIIFAPMLSGLLLPHGSAETTLQTLTNMMRIMLIYPLFVGLSNTFGSILQSYHHFFSYGLSAIFYNVGIIGGIVLLHDSLGIYSAGVGVIAGFLFHMLIRLYEMKYIPFHFTWTFDFKNPYLLQILKTMPPRVLTLLSTYIVLLATSIVGFSLTEGAIAGSTYARNFQSFAISIFGISVATAVLPSLSGFFISGEVQEFKSAIERSIRDILYFTIPSCVGLAVISIPLITFILGGGTFNQNSIFLTSTLLVVYTLSIPFESVMHVFSRVFYAKKKIGIPTIASIAFMLTSLSVLFLCKDVLGVWVLAWAWVIGTVMQSCILIIAYIFHTKGRTFTNKFYVEMMKVCFSSVVMYFGVQYFLTTNMPTVIHLIGGSLVGIIIYALCTLLLRSTMTLAIVQRMKF